MERVEKAKIGLDEIRMLTLGVQVLVGFQLQECFQPRFEQLSAALRSLQITGLLILLACLGVLLVPATQHILVEHGDATARLERLITICLNWACLGLAVVLAADIHLAVRRTVGAGTALTVGLLTGVLALTVWFGWPHAVRGRRGLKERRMALERVDQPTPLAQKIDQMLIEARTILPGAQALLGFQLAVVLTEAFDRLGGQEKLMHVVALLLVALTVMLLMTPAAVHRIVYAGEESEYLLTLGSRFVVAATLPLAAALALDTFVVCARALDSQALALALGASIFVVLVSLWWLFPLAARSHRTASPER
jgi:hypothetical protein